MREADAYFLAQRFPVGNKDILYLANAPLDELQKFLALLDTLTGPAIAGVVVKRSAP